MRDREGVFYGFDHIPTPDEPATGGIVKLQDLQRAFPNKDRSPSMVYFVSSSLPAFPVRMAKMARRAGAKIVLNQNGIAYPGWYGEGWHQVNRPMKRLLHMSDYVFYQSRFCKEAADQFLEHRGADFEILYNPVDTNFFTPSHPLREDTGTIRILTAGSFQSFYRIRCAFECLRHLLERFPEIRLTVAGKIAWKRSMQDALMDAQQLARRLEIEKQVDFLGPYTQAHAPKLFSQFHLLLHTKYNDPCPRLVVEALSCGLPVAYSATGGVPELVGSEAGIGVPGPMDWDKDHPPDPTALAEAVSRILAGRERFAAAARRRAVQRFDVGPWIERHREIFSKLN